MLQSVRRHSAIVLIVTVNGMQQIYPVDISPIKAQSQSIVYGLWGFPTSQDRYHLYRYLLRLTRQQNLIPCLMRPNASFSYFHNQQFHFCTITCSKLPRASQRAEHKFT